MHATMLGAFNDYAHVEQSVRACVVRSPQEMCEKTEQVRFYTCCVRCSTFEPNSVSERGF